MNWVTNDLKLYTARTLICLALVIGSISAMVNIHVIFVILAGVGHFSMVGAVLAYWKSLNKEASK